MSLEIKNLSFSYRCFPVLKNIDCSLKEGNLVCVLGKNGVGKSTLFRCILGALKNYEGEIYVNEKNIRTMNEGEMARKIAYIPQNHSAIYSFDVVDMVMMGTTSMLKGFRSPGKKERALAMAALHLLEIDSLANRSFCHLSGGEQQLVLIARALAQQTKILVMDEPCANLDYGNQIRVMEALKKLAKMGYLIIQSTHNPEHAFLYANQAMVLLDGSILKNGRPKDVLTEEVLLKMYETKIAVYDLDENLKVCIPKRKNERKERYVEAV
ncbi:MAG: ABC transporter ATP-binding protein [Acetivibrio sp.]